METAIINLFKDASFMGSLMGAFLSGLVAIVVLFLGIKHQNNLLEKSELEQFIREASYLSNALGILIIGLDNYILLQKKGKSLSNKFDEWGEPSLEMYEITEQQSQFEEDIYNSMGVIRTVDRKSFIYESLDIYMKILNVFSIDIERVWGSKRSIESISENVEINDYILELDKLKKELDVIVKNSRKKYKKLI